MGTQVQANGFASKGDPKLGFGLFSEQLVFPSTLPSKTQTHTKQELSQQVSSDSIGMEFAAGRWQVWNPNEK